MSKNEKVETGPDSSIIIDNDNSGVFFRFAPKKDNDREVSILFDESVEFDQSVRVTLGKDKEVSVVFSADAWVSIVDGKLAVKMYTCDPLDGFDIVSYDVS